MVKYLIEMVKLKSINSVCPQNIKLDLYLTNSLEFRSFNMNIKESNTEINIEQKIFL